VSGRTFTDAESGERTVIRLFVICLFLRGVKNPFQYSVFCPAVDSDVDGMPGAEGFRKGPPFTAVFTDIDDGIKEPAVIDFYIFPLCRDAKLWDGDWKRTGTFGYSKASI
jgi:hypothetical protein